MAKRIRNCEWKNDGILKLALEKHVADNLYRSEVLDFVERDLSQYY